MGLTQRGAVTQKGSPAGQSVTLRKSDQRHAQFGTLRTVRRLQVTRLNEKMTMPLNAAPKPRHEHGRAPAELAQTLSEQAGT
jgi:hypothetical protein